MANALEILKHGSVLVAQKDADIQRSIERERPWQLEYIEAATAEEVCRRTL